MSQVCAFGGSRSLSDRFSPFVAGVVSAWRRSGGSVAVGCAAGADAAVLRACFFGLAAGCPVSVFAVGAADGSGFWSGSDLGAVRLAASRGAPVAWLAGGPLSVPLMARLIRRSLAALSGASCACFFLASPSSSGSLRVAAAAVAAGLPVFVFSCGFSAAPVPLAGVSGAWVPASFCGFNCWRWSPAADQLSLF
jgi:hypothetical protein